MLIRRGLAALARAEALGGVHGPYALQAAIAACHARARTAGETDWTRIAALYDELAAARRARRSSSSTARWRSPWRTARRPAWKSSTRLTWEPSLKAYHLLPSVRGDLLVKLGRLAEARPRIRAGRRDDAQRARARTAAEAGRGVRDGLVRIIGALRCPPVLPDISPQVGRSAARPRQSVAADGERRWRQSPHLRGRCPAGQRGREGTQPSRRPPRLTA